METVDVLLGVNGLDYIIPINMIWKWKLKNYVKVKNITWTRIPLIDGFLLISEIFSSS